MAESGSLSTNKMQYGKYRIERIHRRLLTPATVRLGNSGLKVSRIILGTMQYGDKRWQPWVIDDEEEAFRQIKFAYVRPLNYIFCMSLTVTDTCMQRYDAGIQTFDTANVCLAGAPPAR